jgi:hypothetical protein
MSRFLTVWYRHGTCWIPRTFPMLHALEREMVMKNAMQSTAAGRDDVVATFGPIDDVTVAQVLGIGATREELAEARAWLDFDEALINSGRPRPSGRVGALVQILETLDQEEAAASEPP